MVLCGTLVSVVPLLYDYSGMTLEALLYRAERATKGRAIQSVGIIAEGNFEEIRLIEGAICLIRMVNGLLCFASTEYIYKYFPLGFLHVIAVHIVV